MKNFSTILAVVLLQVVSGSVCAQKSGIVTLNQALAAEAYVRDSNIRTAILWCACCEGEEQSLVSLKKLYHRATAKPDEYEILMESASKNANDGEPFEINLTHLWVKSGREVVNLGKKVNPEIDPCSEPFLWTFGN